MEQRVFWGSNVDDAVETVQKFLRETIDKYEIISIQYLKSDAIIYGIVVYKWKGV